jgi:immune inhibitor A
MSAKLQINYELCTMNYEFFRIFAAESYELMTMKKLFLIAISCLQLAFNIGVLAAPPLRVLTPMRLADGSMVMPSNVTMASAAEGCCASPAMIGVGSYLQHTGSPRILTILAAFQDVGFTVNDPVKAFDQYLNGNKQEDLGNMNHMNVASVRQYFNTCSYGNFTPQFDVVGPLTLPQNMAYYGGKNNKGSDDRFSDFCRDALELAKDIVSDWSTYDNDKDDRIELVCVIFAGYGQNQGGADSSIWAKASYQNIKVNDTQRISRFNCCPELFHPQYPDYINGTGVFIHEFSHCMGLPDLYATTSTAYVNNQGMETFSIMDYGLYNRNGFAPCPYNAWEQEVMGWTKIEELKPTADSQQQVSDLLPLIEGGKAYKLVNADNDRDYIVMENIQKRGLNTYSAAHGLLVYHVDYPYNTVNMTDAPNSNPGHPGVAVVPAGGTLISSYLRGKGKKYTNEEWKESLSSSVFPGPENVTALTSQMQLPNYCFWNSSKAKETNYMLNSISENEGTGTVSFIVASDKPSSIDDVRWLKADDSKTVYDLQGRKIQGSMKPGIYIVDGKKIYVK